jgi:hypothetical protein
MNTKKCLCLMAIATSLMTVPLASAQDDRRYERRENWKHDGRDTRHLMGRWYFNGERDKPAEIFTSQRGLQARNENGRVTRLVLSRNGDVRAVDWENRLRGDVKRDRIEWENGTTWTRQPTRRVARR